MILVYLFCRRNSVRDIKEYFIKYSTYHNHHNIIDKFKNIKEKELSVIIENFGYIKEYKHGKNYLSNIKKKDNPSYNIFLPHIS